jgi:hypothetical protein
MEKQLSIIKRIRQNPEAAIEYHHQWTLRHRKQLMIWKRGRTDPVWLIKKLYGIKL